MTLALPESQHHISRPELSGEEFKLLSKRMESTDPPVSEDALHESLLTLGRGKSSELLTLAIDKLPYLMGQVIANPANVEDAELHALTFVERLLRHIENKDDYLHFLKVTKAIKDILPASPLSGWAVRRAIKQLFNQDASLARETSSEIFAALGLDYSKYESAWMETGAAPEAFDATCLIENVYSVVRMEQLRKGICKELAKPPFRIMSPARFGVDALVRQYDQRNDEKLSYGNFIASRYDREGAIFSIRQTIDQFTMSLAGDDGCAVRFYEVADNAQVDEAFAHTKFYGQELEFSVWFGHGGLRTLRNGPEERMAQDPDRIALTIPLLETIYRDDGLRAKYHYAFKEKAQLFLMSCGSAEGEGRTSLAARTAYALGIAVLGLTESTHVVELTGRRLKGGRLALDVVPAEGEVLLF
jgi:hypothetical protein